ncbi:prepilin-type N-terminal cleavage/methylation domain-containing protein [Vibrio sp. FNV 38]|nr:prepilin-type N-terminal cleavage/methylation domain-containing protein [Vibrio sp. FNV 38]
MKKTNGFTLVELVIVIILVGIVSSYAASRYFGKSSFSAYTYQEGVVSVIRQVQLNRMQSNTQTSASDSFILEVSSTCLGSAEACLANQDSQRSDVIRDSSVSFNPPQIIKFDLLGNPLSGAVAINIMAEGSNASVCINSQGYVYKDC